MAANGRALGHVVCIYPTYDPWRNYLHIMFETSVSSRDFVPATDVYRYERRRFEGLPNTSHNVYVPAKPRGHVAPQELGHHLDRRGGGYVQSHSSCY